jgi:flagellar protein FlaG
METAIVARPAAVSAQAASARAESLVSNNRIRTELPRSATVNGTYGSSSTSFEPSHDAREQSKREAAVRDTIKRNLTVDPKTREIVYQAVDTKSGEIIRQIPSDAILRLRAYYRDAPVTQEQAAPTPEEKEPLASPAPRVERIV